MADTHRSGSNYRQHSRSCFPTACRCQGWHSRDRHSQCVPLGDSRSLVERRYAMHERMPIYTCSGQFCDIQRKAEPCLTTDAFPSGKRASSRNITFPLISVSVRCCGISAHSLQHCRARCSFFCNGTFFSFCPGFAPKISIDHCSVYVSMDRVPGCHENRPNTFSRYAL
jgi:hypothetical protein